MMGFGAEVCVGDAELIVVAKLQQTLTVVVTFSNSKAADTVWPRLVVTTNPSIKITQYDEAFGGWDALDYGFKLAVEVILYLVSRHKSWCVRTQQCDRSIIGV